MAFLSPPRLYFKGGFVTNVDTANNNDVQGSPNYVDCRNVRMRLDAIAPGTTAEDFRAWCKSAGLPAGWNPLGDNACWFKDAIISGCDVGAGLVTDAIVEPLIGAKLHIGKAAQRNSAIMVDIDPEGVLGTQLFSDQIRIDKGLTPRLSGQPGKAYSYWLHFARNQTIRGFTGASAVWQFEVPLGALTLNTAGSPFLQAVEALEEDRRGLVLRFATYLVAAKYTSAELAQRFAAGHLDENPAQGVVLGSIGVSDPDQIGTAPSGRPLFAAATFSTSHEPWSLGPASATVDETRQKVVLDLLSTFPEEGPEARKVDVGPAYLAYVDQAGQSVRIGGFEYGTDSFNQCAGIAEVDVPAAMMANVLARPLEIHLEKHRQAASRERPVRVETPARGFYLEPGKTVSIPVRLTRYGKRPGTATTIQIAHYDTSDGNFTMPDAATPLLSHPDAIVTDADGVAQLTVRAEREGVGLIRFLEPGQDPSVPAEGYVGIFSRLDFCNVRILPADDYSALSDAEVSWDLVYKEIFEYYYCLYPTMDRFVRLNDEASVRAAGASILARMHPDLSNRWEYMPRTRELSSGKRELFERWLHLA